MFAKGRGSAVPSDGQAWEKLALYVYEYLLHVRVQKSAETFLSEIRWEKNITLGEPPGFLHSWWCVFGDLYCAAPERRDTCEHSSEAKAFHDYTPCLATFPPTMGCPIPPGFFQGLPGSQPSPHAQPPPHNPSSMIGPHSQMGNQPPGGVPGTQPLLPNSMDPTRQQGHPNMGGSMQRMNPPRGMGPMGPGPQNYGSGMRPPPNSLGPPCPGLTWARELADPGPILTVLTQFHTPPHHLVPMWDSRSNFPMGPGLDGPMGGMGGMEPHHMNGSLGSGDIDGLPKNSPNNISGISNPPGTPRDDGELGGNFLHSFQNDNYSPSMTMSV
uniref:Uncharacterized protein n=1 Tax=Gorilla gorilla gorilla TaxID=9595 RepID=A0A2I2YRW7_GORGO